MEPPSLGPPEGEHSAALLEPRLSGSGPRAPRAPPALLYDAAAAPAVQAAPRGRRLRARRAREPGLAGRVERPRRDLPAERPRGLSRAAPVSAEASARAQLLRAGHLAPRAEPRGLGSRCDALRGRGKARVHAGLETPEGRAGPGARGRLAPRRGGKEPGNAGAQVPAGPATPRERGAKVSRRSRQRMPRGAGNHDQRPGAAEAHGWSAGASVGASPATSGKGGRSGGRLKQRPSPGACQARAGRRSAQPRLRAAGA